VTRPAPSGLPPLPWALLTASCFGVFAASCSGTTRAPFLIDMARDLGVSVVLVANLVALTSTAWGITSLLAGSWSARWGRRPFLIGGPLVLAAGLAGVSMSGSFAAVAGWATLAGGSAGAYTGVIYAEVSARVPDRQRGRALGWVMSGQSLTLVLGVPLAAWLGAYVGWRGVNVVLAGLGIAAALALGAVSGAAQRRPRAGREGSLRAAMSPQVLRLLGVSLGERICYGLTAVYFATFLQTSFDLALAGVAMPLGVFALGNILGTVVGGQLADRLPNRLRTFAGGMTCSAAAALALYGWTPDLATSVGLGFVYVLFNALARPSMMAALADVPDSMRGAVMGLNVTVASAGWLGAAGLGGILMATSGFWSFGPLTAVVALLTAALAMLRLPR
jgi:predicted MFS family arabinose efflux permease